MAKGKSDPHQTPAMRQYHTFKKQHPDCVLFFRMGDFYEVFYDDAVNLHRDLGLTLTQRTEGIPMAGVPYHAVETYLQKALAAGYRVAMADQVQDPREAKGVVERAVTRVVTPGTLVDDTLLDDAQANRIGAILFTESGDESHAHLAVAEVSTGSFELFDLTPDTSLDEVMRLGLSELLYSETANGEAPIRVARLAVEGRPALTPRASWHFRQAESVEILTSHFGVTSMAGFGLTDDDRALGAAGALLRFMLETQAPNAEGSRLRHVRPPRRTSLDTFLTIDAASLRSLEIERTMRTGEINGSLLGVLQGCHTPMGKRLLRQWLCFPLRDIAMIESRQRAVGAFLDDRDLVERFADTVRPVQDVARIAGRIALGRALPRDLVALGRSVSQLDTVLDLFDQRPAFEPQVVSLRRVRDSIVPLAERVVAMCVDDAPAHLREGGLIRDGVDGELDEARQLQTNANEWLAKYQRQLVEETGIPVLKVGYNRVFGYYIEVTKAQSAKVPDTFTRKQTLKNAERYITPPLKEFETRVLNASQQAVDREQFLFASLCQDASEVLDDLTEFADTVAELDVLACFADRAKRFGYVCPALAEEPILDIRAGRHPVLDQILRERFVPNDCAIGAGTEADGATMALITGPNMAGKSTYIRQVAILTLMAHTGSYIPAEAATIGLTDRIFTRIGASDELHAGRSTFMVEMIETANILHHATPASVVVLDEIGRGTSTLDGLSLAWAIAESLASIGSRTLFATHYHEITGMAEQLEATTNLHVAVREWGDEIVFLYRILPGRTDQSYGIHVAKIAGVPTTVIDRARQLLETLEVQTDTSQVVAPVATTTPAQMSLFTEFLPHPVVEKLATIEIESLSPLEAFDLLRTLRESVK